MAFVSTTPLSLSTSSSPSTCTSSRSRVTISMSTKPGKSRRFVPGKGAATAASKKKLEPEEVYMEVRPGLTELIIPTLSILTVIGIIPFVGSVCRQAWVRYKVTNRRISISSGFQGRDLTEIIYRDIDSVKFVRRIGGTGDMVLELKDGAKLELRTVPEMDKIYEYIMSQVDETVRDRSGSA